MPATRLTTPLFILTLLAALLSGCATSSSYGDQTANWDAKHIYTEAMKDLNNGNYDTAITLFEKLEGRYPYGRYAEQGRLEIAYAHYKNGETDSAILSANHFIKLYPRQTHVDYAYYLRALAAFGKGQSFLSRAFGQDPSERDPKQARKAFQYFAELVKRFPDSRYTPDAIQHMIFLRNQLAQYEIHVADFYLRRGANLAAVNRARYVVENYPKTPSVADALVVMIRGYRRLELPGLARDALRVLKKNYPALPGLARLEKHA